jgi:hypothetical protein
MAKLRAASSVMHQRLGLGYVKGGWETRCVLLEQEKYRVHSITRPLQSVPSSLESRAMSCCRFCRGVNEEVWPFPRHKL